MMGNLVVSLLAGLSHTFGSLPVTDIVLIWVYDIICLFIIDCLKVLLLRFFKESEAVLPENTYVKYSNAHEAHTEEATVSVLVEQVDKSRDREDKFDEDRLSMASQRLSEWNDRRATSDERLSMKMNRSRGIPTTVNRSSINKSHNINMSRGSFVVSDSVGASRKKLTSSFSSLQPSIINTGGTLRPNTPATNPARVKIDR